MQLVSHLQTELVGQPAFDDDLARARVRHVAPVDHRVAPAPPGHEHLQRALARAPAAPRQVDAGDLEPQRAGGDVGQRAHAPLHDARRPVVEPGDHVGKVGAIGRAVEAGREREEVRITGGDQTPDLCHMGHTTPKVTWKRVCPNPASGPTSAGGAEIAVDGGGGGRGHCREAP